VYTHIYIYNVYINIDIIIIT